MYFFALRTCIASARLAFVSPSLTFWCISLISFVPAIAIRPLFLFIIASISAGVYLVHSSKNVTIAGSISPLLVPIISPSSGVKPMLVSTHFPPFIAQTDAPEPICRLIAFSSFSSLPSSFAACLLTYSWLVPCAPYLRIL